MYISYLTVSGFSFFLCFDYMLVDGFKIHEHGTHEDRSLESFINCLNGCQLNNQDSSSLFHRVRRSGKSLELVPAGIETDSLVSEKKRKETGSKINNEENIEVTNKPNHKTTLSDILRSRSGTTHYMSVTEGSDSSLESSDQSSQELNDDEDVVGHEDISSSWNCHHLCLRNSNIFG
ncbi:uncharacterized protein LOC127721339 [Mytilus californianus]|uniref:uncharacterized protein LOC127721339 n=1 Tax=Mytilus californianus TaxID=6549 RepID=UPI002245EB4A|nr:uncharacterized protein LOC127721339 [Mytilus californianus]